METRRDVQVVRGDGWWRVEAEGMTLAETRTEVEAIRVAQSIAREHGRTLLIRGLNGEIRDFSSYDRKPSRSPGVASKTGGLSRAEER
jgi:hypothetical protein